MPYKVAVIGCGGRGRAHAQGYAQCYDTQLVACADPFPEARQAFAEKFFIPNSYADYHEMLEKEKPDIVSICTWTGMHKEMTLAAVAAGVKAIHSEKPMAPNFGDAKAIIAACNHAGVVITYCHQRRFGGRFVTARNLLRKGAIGEITRIEGYCHDLIDWGTHWFDMLNFYNNETPAEWVMGQIDAAEERSVFGLKLETRGLSHIKYRNGVHGLVVTGDGSEHGGRCDNRIIGSEGMLEVSSRGKPVRLLNGNGWSEPALDNVLHPDDTTCTIVDLVESLKTGREPELSGRKALAATELIFATYESARRRARVELPLTSEDSAFLSLLETGEIGPAQAQRSA
ncbi:MAG TPA: Gfo/Idh/MocA family oxidoreductase [Limnochordia bacterium]|nr:Gfo/Idh/MocA family oxidoreductase [Limnochordia bacterium]